MSAVSAIRRFTAAQNKTNSRQFEEFPEGLGERQTHKCSALNCSELSRAFLVIFRMEAVSMQETSAQWILLNAIQGRATLDDVGREAAEAKSTGLMCPSVSHSTVMNT